MRSSNTPTMAEHGALANVIIAEGGRAEGTLGEAAKLRALVRKLTPKQVLGEASTGAVFGGGRRLMGEGMHQESIKAVVLDKAQVITVPAEQLQYLKVGQMEVTRELRNHIAFQLTYWFRRNSMIDAQVRHAP
jgi:hypothetical protein